MPHTLWAYQFGNMKVPESLRSVRDNVVKDPARCITDLQQLAISQPAMIDFTDETTHANGYRQWAVAKQLMALCQLKLAQFDQAIDTISPISQAEGLNAISRVSSDYITALIYARMPEKQKMQQAISLLLNGFKQLEGITGFDANNLRYQLSRELGRLYSLTGNYPEAKKLLELAQRQAKLLHNGLLEGWADLFLGDYYNRIDQAGQAMLLYVEASKKGNKRQAQAKYLAARAAQRIAVAYKKQNELKLALTSAKKSVQLFQKLGNEHKLLTAYILLAELYVEVKDNNLALVQFINGLELAKGLDAKPLVARIRKSAGEAALHLGRYNQAQKQLELARQLYREQRNYAGLHESLILLGELYLKRNEAAMAAEYLQMATELNEKHGPLAGRANIYKLLSNSYKRKGLFSEALDYFQKYHQASLQQQTVDAELKKDSFKLQYELVVEQQKNRRLEQEAQLRESHDLQLRFFAFGLCVLTLFILIFVVILRKRSNFLKQENSALNNLISNHPVTGLPDANRYPGFLEALLSDYPIELPAADLPRLCIAVIKLDCFIDMYESRGGVQANKILGLLGRFVKNHFHGIKLYHLRDDQLLAITPFKAEGHSAIFGQLLVDGFTRFTQQVRLPNKVSVGICGYPFLPHAPNAVSELKTLEVAYVALQGAKLLHENNSEAQWLALTALSCMHPAFIGGEVRTQCRQAIQKGLIKVNHAGERVILPW